MSHNATRGSRHDGSVGFVDKIIGIFSPYAAISRQLQGVFQLDRGPGCRAEHGRFEILLRGAGMTERPIEERVTLATQLTDAVRPMLRAESKRQYRRYAERAIAVVFEDEQVIGSGIATTSFTYVASVDHDPDQAFHQNIRRETSGLRQSR